MKKFAKIIRIFLVFLIVLVVFVHAHPQQKQGDTNQQQQIAKRQRQKVKPNRVPNNKLDTDDAVAPINGGNKKKKNQKGTSAPTKFKKVTKTIPNLGRVRGRIIKTQWSGKNIMQFLDIPYAASPSGPLRFKVSI